MADLIIIFDLCLVVKLAAISRINESAIVNMGKKDSIKHVEKIFEYAQKIKM